MAYDLTLVTPTYGAAKFGNGITGGTGYAPGLATATGTAVFTIEAWVKTSALSSGQQCATGQGGYAEFGMASSNATAGNAYAYVGNTGQITINTTVNIADNVPHHMALVKDATSIRLYVDGVLAGSSTVFPTDYDTTGNSYGVNSVRYAGNIVGRQWFLGYVDEVVVWNTAKYTANFTPPTTAYAGTESGMMALYHLDSTGVDSKVTGTAPGAPTIGTATAGSGSASVAFTAGTAGSTATTGYTAISTPGSFTGTAAASPITVSGLTNGTAYTFTVHATNSIGNSPESAASNSVAPTAAAATAITVSGPTTGVAGVASSNFTVSANGVITGTVTVTPSDGGAGGTIAPASVPISSATPTGTFTYTPSTVGAKTLSFTNNGALTNQANLTYTATAGQMSLIQFSPYNWNIATTRATSINPGAYFRTLFTGASCTLNFDLTGEGAAPAGIWYRVDYNAAWLFKDIAATVVIDMTGSDTSFATTGHVLEVVFRYINQAVTSRWTPQQCAVVFTGITLASGTETLILPPIAGTKNILVFGDSITEGVLTYSGAYSQDAMSGYAFELRKLLGADVGVVGFASQGFAATGIPTTPIFGSTWNSIYSGVARTFSPAPDLVVINQGTNDGATDITAAATSTLNAMLAALPTTTKIVVMRPFNGNAASFLQAAVTATGSSRVSYMDTTGFKVTTGNVHPLANESITRIAPNVANALQPLLVARGTRTPRTITLTLTSDGTTILPNLTGLKWSINDIAVPSTQSVIADSGLGATTNASGVMTLTVNTTVASGGTVWLDVSDTTGTVSTTSKFFSGPVVVA